MKPNLKLNLNISNRGATVILQMFSYSYQTIFDLGKQNNKLVSFTLILLIHIFMN